MIKVLFFAGLREQLACDSLDVDAEGVSTLGELREALRNKGETWRLALGNDQLQMACNQQLSHAQAAVRDGDEVAFFPPVTGG
ncbi:molybdopterin synthase sulfur carrier subunit [Microbulbifer sp. SA54]|uniref:molybdopterin synthase sulfur carrier subunit n=1 Tax=Microbulbifer sp. SA54 TaxID=3401577 RepID=UPI003AADF18C